jgi:branched-chain amino acid aminotransferase
MGFFASVNGEITPAEQARVSVLDNGFAFGDGVYETLRTYGGRPFHLDRHLARLRDSARMLAIDVPPPDGALAQGLEALLEAADNPESYIRIMVTRGVGEVSYRFERIKGPTIVMLARAYEPLPERAYAEGVAVILSSVRRNHPRAVNPAMKSCNLINNILAMREAQAKGALEPILLNELGEVAEGAGSNVFLVRGGRLLTPPLDAGILPGVTRGLVLELARSLALPSLEEPVAVKDLLAADEVFLTSTLKELAPVAAIDGRKVGSGRPGSMTLALLDAYREYARRA